MARSCAELSLLIIPLCLILLTVRPLTPSFQILVILVPALLCLLRDSDRSCDDVIAHYECKKTRKLFLLDERRPSLGLSARPKVEAMRADKDPGYAASPSEAGWGIFLLKLLDWVVDS